MEWTVSNGKTAFSGRIWAKSQRAILAAYVRCGLAAGPQLAVSAAAAASGCVTYLPRASRRPGDVLVAFRRTDRSPAVSAHKV
ncbi:hypothetical protein Y032_0115g506 [Ancylostoma ceylanicum]|uniref:Uncharacterized protein n=1 Tax=Ancylostoma ceylanicum TaxID=53326 RepID=A0A016TCZ0_9BILA|nr:hypothetical protein Y032_0115g506 [Ancylostoma ceylanicum]